MRKKIKKAFANVSMTNMRDGSMNAFHEIMYRMYLKERSPEVQSKDF